MGRWEGHNHELTLLLKFEFHYAVFFIVEGKASGNSLIMHASEFQNPSRSLIDVENLRPTYVLY